MMFKNAGLKKGMAKEAAQRMLNGEVFYIDGNQMDFRQESERPFGIHYGASGIRYTIISEWELLSDWEIKEEWYNNRSKPVLCWVSDKRDDIREKAVYITNVDMSYIYYPFYSESEGEWFKYATPVKKEELL